MSEEKISRKNFVSGAAATGLTLALGSRLAPLAQAAPLKERTAAYLAKQKTILIAIPAEHDLPDHLDMVNGTQLAVEEINGAGGLHGRKLALTTTDFNTFDPQSTQLAFQKLVGEKPAAITCAYAAAVVPAGNIAAAYGCPYINGDTAEQGQQLVINDPGRYSNRFSDASDRWYGEFFPTFLAEAKAKGWKPTGNTVHIVESSTAYAQLIGDVAKAALNGSGNWSVVRQDQVGYPTLDWSAAITSIQQTKPAVIMISHSDPASEAAFAKQWAANPVKGALLYLQYAPSQGAFLELAGPAANGIVWSSVYAVPPTKTGKAFIAKYKKRFNTKTPGIAYTGFGYDATHILFQAWKAVGDPMRFKAVNRYIKAHTYQGVAGLWDFRSPGSATVLYPDQETDPKKGIPHMYFQIQNGQHVALAPSPFSNGKYMAPPWA